MQNKILVIADYKGWAFDKIYKNLKKHSTFSVDVWYLFDKSTQLKNHESYKKYDLIFYLCDFDIRYLQYKKIPNRKLLLAIRSNLSNEIFENSPKLQELVGGVAVANDDLYSKFLNVHPNTFLFSGGVDIDLFSFKQRILPKIPRIGWAGSRDNFGSDYRGLNLIEEACKKLGFKFNPALREDKFRNEVEMVSYYHNDIDIYIDASLGAGRQNGLVEAGSTGIPLISTNVGVANKLINSNTGIIIDRTVDSIANGILQIIKNYDVYSRNIRSEIVSNWSWDSQVKIFDHNVGNIYFR